MLKLKRDETGTGFPSTDQIEVGELVINSKTGKLYSKLTDGSIIEWIGKKICFEPTPNISFMYNNGSVQNINNFCCAGDTLLAVITNLKLEPEPYTFDFIELTENSSSELITISAPEYSTYQETVGTVTRTLRKAIVPINFSIDSSEYTNVSIFKFSVLNDIGTILSEQIITFKCIEGNQ